MKVDQKVEHFFDSTIDIRQEKKQTRKKFFIIAGLIIVALFGGLLTFIFLKKKSVTQEDGSYPKLYSAKNFYEVTPTPMPFFEITIPGLRSREYKSNLGQLEKVSKSSEYTSYLTSYDSDGFKVNGLLTIPEGKKPESGWPAIIFVHGYIPPRNYQTLVNYSDYVSYLARSGFVVFKIDLRGHGTSEGEAGGAYYSADYVVDVLSAKSALQDSGFVNPSKIGFWGHSMAGNVVSRAMAASPDTPAIVIWAGAVYTYSDFSEFGIQDGSYRPPPENSQVRQKRNKLFKTYGQFNPNDPFWKLVPMTNFLDDIKGSIQLNHAVDDNVVSIEFSRNLSSILKKKNVSHELYEYSTGGHNITGSSFNNAMQNTVNFFRKHLN